MHHKKYIYTWLQIPVGAKDNHKLSHLSGSGMAPIPLREKACVICPMFTSLQPQERRAILSSVTHLEVHSLHKALG